MSDTVLLKFNDIGKEFYAEKNLAAKFVVAYDDVSMEVVDLDDMEA